jgi:membrane associated rhomboid family serine protease
MLFPFRVKNPVSHFPFATLAIILANLLVYVSTTHYGLIIREDVVRRCAFELGATPLWTSITAAFLHAEPFHLIGNMVFLWVFGPSVEDRLRPPLFLVAYFGTGFIGDLLQTSVDFSVIGQARPAIGASGCVMGILGAYWYMFSWSPVCVFYWISWFWVGVWEVAAVWIIGIYVMLDVVYGVLFSSLGGAAGAVGGVAHFAHIGGAVAGALFCLVLRAKRDPEAVSEAKALYADARDLSNVPLHALRVMSDQDPGNPDLIRAMTGRAVREGRQDLIHQAMARAGPKMIDIDPDLVAWYLADFHGDATAWGADHLLRLARSKQEAGDYSRALKLYQILVRDFPQDEAVEMALYKMAECHWNAHRDPERAKQCLAEMGRRFPYGLMASYGEALLRQMGRGGA